MPEFKSQYAQFIADYARLELQIQEEIADTCGAPCKECTERCCEESICRESIESPFLALLVEDQGIEYDDGWMGPTGCRLRCGRPLVCYEFFCDNIIASDSLSALRKRIKVFVAIGSKMHGSRHLLCIQDLEQISDSKMQKAHQKILKMLDAESSGH